MKKHCLTVAVSILFLLCSVFFLALPAQTLAASDVEQSIGIGLGLPYGLFGVNYEVGVNDWFAPTIGIGITPAGLGWNLGVRLYYPERDKKFRWRATALYGTNTILETRYYWQDSDYESDEGLSVGLGFDWLFGKKWSLATDLFYVDSDVPPGYEEYGPDIKSAIGFSRRF